MTPAERLRLYHAATDSSDDGEHCMLCGALIGEHTERERELCNRAAGLGPFLDLHP